ncbi:MAG: hypothetical protein QM784_29070 [Polyangiaceae bacterium]
MFRFTQDCDRHGPASPGDAIFEAPRVLVELWLVELPEGVTSTGSVTSPREVATTKGARLIGTPHALADIERTTHAALQHLVIPAEPQRLRFVDATVTPLLRSAVNVVIDVEVVLEHLRDEGTEPRRIVLRNTFLVPDREASQLSLPIEGTQEQLFLGVRAYVTRGATDLRDFFLCNVQQQRALRESTRLAH